MGRFSPTEVINSHISRIGELDGKLHAYTDVYSEEASAFAAASSRRYEEGRALGPLDGVPVAIKDLVQIAGKPCAAGSPALLHHPVSQETASVVTRLVQRGMIVLGKTHTVEYAMGGWGTNAHLGTPRNPWFPDTHYTPGGSSSGSAVAVAARIATLALGTDTGGSVRIPAAFNGIVGLMTTPGLIAVDGIVPLSPSLDTVGPMGRTVSDVALMFEALLDQSTSNVPVGAELHRGIAGLRLGAVGDEDVEGIDTDVFNAYQASLQRCKALDAEVAVVNLPRRLRAYQQDSEIMMAEAYAMYGQLAEDPAVPMDPAVRTRVLSGAMSARSYIQARDRARSDAQSMLAALEGFDALLTPTTAVMPIPVSEVDETTSPSMFTRFVNQLRFCALAVPNGLSPAGLPTSLQIVCRPHNEPLALRIGRALEIDDPLIPAMAQ